MKEALFYDIVNLPQKTAATMLESFWINKLTPNKKEYFCTFHLFSFLSCYLCVEIFSFKCSIKKLFYEMTAFICITVYISAEKAELFTHFQHGNYVISKNNWMKMYYTQIYCAQFPFDELRTKQTIVRRQLFLLIFIQFNPLSTAPLFGKRMYWMQANTSWSSYPNYGIYLCLDYEWNTSS